MRFTSIHTVGYGLMIAAGLLVAVSSFARFFWGVLGNLFPPGMVGDVVRAVTMGMGTGIGSWMFWTFWGLLAGGLILWGAHELRPPGREALARGSLLALAGMVLALPLAGALSGPFLIVLLVGLTGLGLVLAACTADGASHG